MSGGANSGAQQSGSEIGGIPGQSENIPLTQEEIEKTVVSYGESVANGMTPEQVSSFKKYTGVSYANINAVLRGIVGEFDPGNLENAINLHSVLEKSELPCDCTVYRGVSAKALGEMANWPDDKLVGKVFWDAGFMSTSLDRNSAFDGDLLLEIHAPKGAHGTYVGHVSTAKHYEKEVLFDIDSNMVIDSVRRDEMGRRVITVRMI